MEDIKTRLKVGIFVVLGMVILVWGYFYLTEFHLKQARYHYKVSFKEVEWVAKGDVVTVLGVPKGAIEDIIIKHDSVLVFIFLDDIQLNEGSYARLESTGLLGKTRMSIVLGDGPLLPEGSIIQGKSMQGLAGLIDNLNAFLVRSDSLFRQGKEFLNKSSLNLEKLTGELTATLAKLQAAIAREETDSTLIYLNRVLKDLYVLEKRIKSGKGSLGKLFMDEKLYLKADSTLAAIRELIEDIKANPKKYVGFKFELF